LFDVHFFPPFFIAIAWRYIDFLLRAAGSFMNKFLRVTIMVLALNFIFTIMQTAIRKVKREPWILKIKALFVSWL